MATLESGFEAANLVVLEDLKGQDFGGLHNVYFLSEQVISGGEPHDQAALQQLADWGVKTVLSVDGKVPDQAAAADLGIRYVHVPIQYRGITTEEVNHIVKSFRELEGPFYVHCFHGKHRGPAAAALGRLVVDGISREQALAEMRQWCGTSGKYEGLYRTVAQAHLPSAEETAVMNWDFPAAHPMEGIRYAMVGMTRSFDYLKALAARDWQPDPEHPDIDALNEAQKLEDVFRQTMALEELAEEDEDFRAWMMESWEWSQKLSLALKNDDGEQAQASLKEIKALCSSCHAGYRNH